MGGVIWALNNNEQFTADGVVVRHTDGTTENVPATYTIFYGSVYIGYYTGGIEGESNAIPTYTEGTLILPESITYEGETYRINGISAYAFQNCEGLTGIEIPDSYWYISSRIILGCTGIKTFTFPASYTGGGSNPLMGSSVETLYVSEGITEFNAYGMAKDVTTLKEVYFPSTLKSVGYNLFKGCTSLETIYWKPDTESGALEFGGTYQSADEWDVTATIDVETAAQAEWILSANTTESDKLFGNTPIAFADVDVDITTGEGSEDLEDDIIDFGEIVVNSTNTKTLTLGGVKITEVGLKVETSDSALSFEITAGSIGEATLSNEGGTIELTLSSDAPGDYEGAIYFTGTGSIYNNEIVKKVTVKAVVTTESGSGIADVAADEAEIVGVYSLAGQRLGTPGTGVNIVKLSNGKTAKILR